MVVLRPNSELVAVAWMKGVPGLSDICGVGTTRPADPIDWSAAVSRVHRWIKAGPVVGGGTNRDVPLRQPVVTFTLYAARIGSSHPAWGALNELSELIYADTYTDENGRLNAGARAVTEHLPTGYDPASVRVAAMINEPRRIPGDTSSYAKYTTDIQIFWVATE